MIIATCKDEQGRVVSSCDLASRSQNRSHAAFATFAFAFRCMYREVKRTNQTMKTLLFAVIVSCLATVSTLAGTEIVISRGVESFEMQGWVLSYEGGFVCKQPNINYELISYDFRNRVKVLLSATGDNEFALRLGMLKQGLYTIAGRWQRGTDCQYVEVASVQRDD